MSKKPYVILIMDGYGLNDNPKGNAVAMAKKPNLDKLFSEYPCVKGYASGLSVGLPDGFGFGLPTGFGLPDRKFPRRRNS